MSPEKPCSQTEARTRARVARAYLDVAELAAIEEADEARNVAIGNAVLAAIAASDAICGVHLGRYHRGQDHQAAAALLRTVRPNGAKLASDLEVALAVKDPAHYGARLLSDTKLKAAMRATARLVEAAETAIAAG